MAHTISMHMIRYCKLTVIYDGLGLRYAGDYGSAALLDEEAMILCTAISQLFPRVALPFVRDEAGLKIVKAGYLDQEIQELFAKFKHIWELGSRRSSTGDLYAHNPKDAET